MSAIAIGLYVLRSTNQWGEVYYFLRFGEVHRNIRLIAETTQNIERARTFETYPEAVAALHEAGDPQGWEVVPKP